MRKHIREYFLGFEFNTNTLFKFSSYKMGVSMNSWFLVTVRIYFKKKVFKYI